MNKRTAWALGALAIFEAIGIFLMLSHPRRVIVTVRQEAARIQNPFYWAFEYESPDSKFEELARKYPEWISGREPTTGWSALPACPAFGRTNVARILITNGANVEAALKELRSDHMEEYAKFLEHIKAELKMP